jgi:hypothetical protein
MEGSGPGLILDILQFSEGTDENHEKTQPG